MTVMGPGSIRVGRFIGRLGVVPMPAIERGLGLVGRVVRRHVAKLEKVGWCERMPTIRGDGMLVWLTPPGLDGVGLGELPALRTPQRFSPRTSHSIRVAWAAADIACREHEWVASREMALAPSQWGIQVANERGGLSRRLPDLAYRPMRDGSLHVAVIVIDGQSNPRRERAALEGWRASILAGQYAHVRYLTGPGAARHLTCVATELGLTARQFIAGEHVMPEEPLVIPLIVERPDEEPVAVTASPVGFETEQVPTPDLTPLSSANGLRHCPSSEECVPAAERAAEHQKLITELLGHDQPTRRRRWGRRAI
jgi:hypothetical protein